MEQGDYIKEDGTEYDVDERYAVKGPHHTTERHENDLLPPKEKEG